MAIAKLVHLNVVGVLPVMISGAHTWFTGSGAPVGSGASVSYSDAQLREARASREAHTFYERGAEGFQAQKS